MYRAPGTIPVKLLCDKIFTYITSSATSDKRTIDTRKELFKVMKVFDMSSKFIKCLNGTCSTIR
uniref:Uncharacterized protein n=1 Tax=Megaselia scalaris TaxID=36166 RepID=T1GT85_MEGSC